MEHYTKSLPYEMALTSRVLHEAMAVFFKNNNFLISPDEYIILDCLYINPDIIQMELAKMILKGRAHTGKFLKSLEEKKMIVRKPVLQNSKIVMQIKITNYGMDVYKNINQTVADYIKKTSIIPEAKILETINFLKMLREDAIKQFGIKFE